MELRLVERRHRTRQLAGARTKVAETQVTEVAWFVAEHSPKLSELAEFGDQIKASFAASRMSRSKPTCVSARRSARSRL